MAQLVAYISKDVSNIMYYDETINKPNAIKFAKAIIKEINGHVDNGDWELVPRHSVSERVSPDPLVWSMQQKDDLVMDEIIKYKAHLNLHGTLIECKMYMTLHHGILTWCRRPKY